MEKLSLKEHRPFPNNAIPVRLYRGAWGSGEVSVDEVEACFTKHGWTPPWVNGIYGFHHFHSNAHEALACLKGEATVCLGGPGGEVVTLRAGDAVLIPAGVGHQLIEASSDYRIAGSYPLGQSPDTQRGEAEDYEAVRERVQQVPLWTQDPVTGEPD